MTPNDTVWGARLGACRVHSDTVMADRVLVLLEEVGRYSDSGSINDSHHLQLSNIYAASNEWEKAERMRTVMSEERFQKTPGHSSYMLTNPEMSFSAPSHDQPAVKMQVPSSKWIRICFLLVSL